MTSSFSYVVNKLAEGIHKIKCKYRSYEKNVKFVELNAKIVTFFMNIQKLKMI